jgi:hypothetical protein
MTLRLVIHNSDLVKTVFAVWWLGYLTNILMLLYFCQGFSGPSLLVQLVIDDKPYGKLETASVHRAKAGDHGFDIPFPCSLINNGQHVVEVQAHKTQTGPVTWDEQVTFYCIAIY